MTTATTTRRKSRLSDEERAARTAQRKELLAKAHTLAENLDAVAEEEAFDRLTERYSINNSLLILLQRPNTKGDVQAFSKWKAAGRSVKKGEHALWILAPAHPSKKADVELEAEGRDRAILGDGAAQTTKKLRFVWVPVFDRSQTEPEKKKVTA